MYSTPRVVYQVIIIIDARSHVRRMHMTPTATRVDPVLQRSLSQHVSSQSLLKFVLTRHIYAGSLQCMLLLQDKL